MRDDLTPSRYTGAMLLDALKARIAQAVKEKDEVSRDVLRLAFGEMQTAEARSGRPCTDEEATAIVRKLVKSNEETLALVGDGAQAPALRREIEVLTTLLPKRMSLEELVSALDSQKDAIKSAKNDGQATGVAMKHLKSTGAAFDGADVSTAVKALRG